jgi:uncharacterized protein YkwD
VLQDARLEAVRRAPDNRATRFGPTTVVALTASLVVLAATTGVAAASPTASCPSAGSSRSAATMRCLLNEARRDRGLRGLLHSSHLDRAAQLRAAAIRRCADFSHTPCGRSFGSAYNTAGYSIATHSVAENLAWGTGSFATATATLGSWLSSSEHRHNLLGRSWRKIGVAVVVVPRLEGARNAVVWVAEFGEP